MYIPVLTIYSHSHTYTLSIYTHRHTSLQQQVEANTTQQHNWSLKLAQLRSQHDASVNVKHEQLGKATQLTKVCGEVGALELKDAMVRREVATEGDAMRAVLHERRQQTVSFQQQLNMATHRYNEAVTGAMQRCTAYQDTLTHAQRELEEVGRVLVEEEDTGRRHDEEITEREKMRDSKVSVMTYIHIYTHTHTYTLHIYEYILILSIHTHTHTLGQGRTVLSGCIEEGG